MVLVDRFEIVRVIGRGGFGLAYLARDHTRNENVVVKELAPEGAIRTAEGLLDMDSLGAAAAQRLRRCFLDEAKLLAKLNLPGIANVRTFGVEAGTAFFVTEYFSDAEPLDEVLRKTGPMREATVLEIAFQLMDTLEAVHARKILHRDLKPANVLMRPNGEVVLIDFGAAREWHADMTEHHTVLFTPGYAPLEQLSEHAKRGPATDVYGLCALLYTLLTGFPPTPATDRLNNRPLISLRLARADINPAVAAAIDAGLALHYAERPQSIEALRALFSREADQVDSTSLAALDAKLVLLKQLRYGKRECPSCSGVLHQPKPLAKGRCPVCTKGNIVARPIHLGACPVCRSSVLRAKSNVDPMVTCPNCGKGILTGRKTGLLSKDRLFDCDECEAHFLQQGANVTYNEETKTWSDWAAQAGRSSEVHVCDGCHAQFDTLSDGQWKQVVPVPGPRAHVRLYPEEWARVAAGLDPGCGTHVCSTCDADYFVDGDHVTLLGAFDDPFLFAEANVGRSQTWEALRWLGAGKFSRRPGWTCAQCHTEFDEEGDYLRLVRSRDEELSRYIDTLQTFDDWHRLARGLPRLDEEDAFETTLETAILDAYLSGKISFDDGSTFWRGPAVKLNDDSAGTLTATVEELSFGGRLKRDKTPMELIISAAADESVLSPFSSWKARGSRSTMWTTPSFKFGWPPEIACWS